MVEGDLPSEYLPSYWYLDLSTYFVFECELLTVVCVFAYVSALFCVIKVLLRTLPTSQKIDQPMLHHNSCQMQEVSNYIGIIYLDKLKCTVQITIYYFFS